MFSAEFVAEKIISHGDLGELAKHQLISNLESFFPCSPKTKQERSFDQKITGHETMQKIDRNLVDIQKVKKNEHDDYIDS